MNVMSREMVLRQYICGIKKQYDYISIDCMPSLGMITINALVAADRVLIPVEAAYLPVKGLQQLIKTIGRVHRKLNPELSIMGILFTKSRPQDKFRKGYCGSDSRGVRKQNTYFCKLHTDVCKGG